MKVFVTGARGLVGRAVTECCLAKGDSVIAVDHHSLDISDEKAVRSSISESNPDVVINCAAWTDVDGCESDRVHAERANAWGPQLLASACRENGSLLITISTDYVFDGSKSGFYTQRDQPNPQSIYAKTKLLGEQRAQLASAHTIIVRSGYIFGRGGKNFLSTFLERARGGEKLRAISDMVGTPTYAIDLAARLRRLAEIDLPGIYHVVNAGEGVSFETFARTGLQFANLSEQLLEPVSISSLARPAPRPRNSRLKCLLSDAIGLDPPRHWRDAVREFTTTGLAEAPAGCS